jgi:hypothetical protein
VGVPFVGRDANGTPRQITRIVKGGKRMASKALANLEAETGAGQHGGARTTGVTVEDLIEARFTSLERLAGARRPSIPTGPMREQPISSRTPSPTPSACSPSAPPA